MLWSPETRARLVSQDYALPSLMSWKTPEYSAQELSGNDHTTAAEGEFSLITAAKGALCQQGRQCKTAGSHWQYPCQRNATATSRVSNDIQLK